jgi:hypothetical protein
MASELKVDKFTGVTTADSISVTTGATTTVLQKGMLKATLHLNSLGGNALSENLNVSSVDDDGTGDFGIHFSNNFNTANYIMTHAVNDGGASTAQFATDITYGTNTTATTDIENHYVTAGDNRTNADSYGIMLMFAGDLA